LGKLSKNTIPIPDDIQPLFVDAPVTSMEDPVAYFNLRNAIVNDVKPNGATEWLMAKDVTDSTWEVWRLQQMKALVIEWQREMKSAAHRMHRLSDPRPGRSAVGRESADATTVQEGSPLRQKDWKLGDIFQNCLAPYQIIDQLLTSALNRRNNTLREIEFRREIFARRVRQASDKFIEATPSTTAISDD